VWTVFAILNSIAGSYEIKNAKTSQILPHLPSISVMPPLNTMRSFPSDRTLICHHVTSVPNPTHSMGKKLQVHIFTGVWDANQVANSS